MGHTIPFPKRKFCATLFLPNDPDAICFAPNATSALNLARKGILQPETTDYSDQKTGKARRLLRNQPMRKAARGSRIL